jgi:hypothetical protein
MRIAGQVCVYQRRTGGWPKNIDMAAPLDASARAAVEAARSDTDSTIDNGATTTQLRFLALVYSATRAEPFHESFDAGLDYLLAAQYPNFQFGLAATIFSSNLEDATNILQWAKSKQLDIVFNMLRFTDAMLGNRDLEEKIGFRQREEEYMRKFFLDRVQEESVLSGQAFMYLHYADMIANGYVRTMPCPFQTQGLLLNPNGELFYCENSKEIGNVLDADAEKIYFEAENLAYRATFNDTICRNCLSPCQVNVGAMKQFIPYAKFLRRAYQVKRDPSKHLDTLPTPP